MLTSFLLLLAAFALYGLLHSITASLWAKALVVRWFGEPGRRLHRLAFSFFAAVSLLPIGWLYLTLPDRQLYQLETPWSLAFLAVQALGAALFLWSILTTDLPAFLGLRQFLGQGGDAERLVVGGPYRWVRHPMYTASLLVIWFNPALSLNLLAVNLSITLYFLIGGYYEEQKLLRQFGEAYARYRTRTPMLIPGLRLGD